MGTATDTGVFEQLESAVRSYCRAWPVVFARARGSWMYDEDGNAYLDFFAGAGALNYGHNNPELKRPLLEYLEQDGVVHALDMHVGAKREFLADFEELVLRPRGLEYRVQFSGPGGTNAVEAALKLARKITGRTDVLSFTNGYHGMTLGSLAVTGNRAHRGAAGVPLANAMPLPFDQALGETGPDFAWFDRLLSDGGSGAEAPAAVIVEAVQGEGGVNVARPEWLRGLEQRCKHHGIVLILDDIQAGCGRTGPFFSFEPAAIVPDIVVLSKSIGGYGLPLSLTLIRPELDIWEPGEHSGTFRGVAPAYVTATAALRRYWRDDHLEQATATRGERVIGRLQRLAAEITGAQLTARGRGLLCGLAFDPPELAARVAAVCFERRLLIETAGPDHGVLKLLPALTIGDGELTQGLQIIDEAVRAVCAGAG